MLLRHRYQRHRMTGMNSILEESPSPAGSPCPPASDPAPHYVPIEPLYQRFGRTAFALAYRIVGSPEAAEEIVQEAFLSVWRNVATYERVRDNPKPWLMTIVRNRAIDHLRAQNARPATVVAQDEILPLPESCLDPADEAIRRIEATAIRAAVASLPALQRRTVELAFFAELSYPEIAAQMGAPLGTVKSRIRLALARLHDHMESPDERGLFMSTA